MADIREEYGEMLKKRAYEIYNGTCYAVASYYENIQPFFKGWRRGNISCPEHDDRSPSLHIYRDKYKCFTAGCNMAGDAYALIMHMEDCTFPEAQEIFAKILDMPTYNEYAKKGPAKMRSGRMSRPFPVSNEVLNLIGLGDESVAILSQKSLGWIDGSGEDAEHDIQNGNFWYTEMDDKPLYIAGRTERLSVKSLWADENYALVHRMIKGKVSEAFSRIKDDYYSNKWNDKDSAYYKQYILHDVLENQLDTLKEVGEKYGLELIYKKMPTYT